MRLLPRRSVIAGAAAIMLGAADAAPPIGTLPRPAGHGGLHARAQRKGLFYGAALDLASLRADPTLMGHITAECGMIVPEGSLTWSQLRPHPDRVNFERAEMLIGYAARHNLHVRGHALVWHRDNPDWLSAALTAQTAERMLLSHVHDIVGHFRRRVAQWEVVNEPVEPEDGNRFGLRASPWFQALGPAYLDLAFHACAAADPQALRILNEYGLDYAVPGQNRRRAAVLELLADLCHRGVPVQALGLQAHLFGAEYRLDQKRLAGFCDAVAGLGLKIVITEMDIRDNELPADVAARDLAVAAHGRDFLDSVLPNRAVIGVTTWGLSDRRTWLNEAMPRLDRLPQRPLPLDAEMRRKPLWMAMAGAFDRLPPPREISL